MTLVLLAATIVGLTLSAGHRHAWLVPCGAAALGLAAGVVETGEVRAAADQLASPLVFLLLAVPLAVELDRTGFFASLASFAGRAEPRRLRLLLWWFAAAVVVVFNLDAAIVLLTPLYLRIARERGEPVVAFCLVPALLASLASSALPVSNLTNLIVDEQFGFGPGPFVRHLLAPTLAATTVGWFRFRRLLPPPPAIGSVPDAPVRRDGLVIGATTTCWLLGGFVAGGAIGVPAWAVVAPPLAWLLVRHRTFPWRDVPLDAAAIAVGLASVTAAAAPHLALSSIVDGSGVGTTIAAFGAAVVGANALNNLPALLAFLPALTDHPDQVWVILLGVDLGPTLWVFGALSTVLWRSTMARLGEPVGAWTYVRTGASVGVPAMAAALTTLIVLG